MKKYTIAIANLRASLSAAGKTEEEIETLIKTLMTIPALIPPMIIVKDVTVLVNRVNNSDLLTAAQKAAFVQDLT